jgi:GT2 family glycosyltransferase
MRVSTVVVIPSRYEPARLRKLVRPLNREAEVIVLDNGHEPPLDLGRVTVVEARGRGIYAMWNMGWRMALERHNPVNVAVLNDDIEILPGTITLMARALRAAPRIGCVYPDPSVRSGQLPWRIQLTPEWDPAGGRSMTGFCFMFKGELPLPPFDEGMEWWYGDSEFDESVKLAGYGVARIDKLPITHISDAELNDWARRPELKEATERDGLRWTVRHDHIVDGRWVSAVPYAEVPGGPRVE